MYVVCRKWSRPTTVKTVEGITVSMQNTPTVILPHVGGIFRHYKLCKMLLALHQVAERIGNEGSIRGWTERLQRFAKTTGPAQWTSFAWKTMIGTDK
jgi:hypothetical protein